MTQRSKIPDYWSPTAVHYLTYRWSAAHVRSDHDDTCRWRIIDTCPDKKTWIICWSHIREDDSKLDVRWHDYNESNSWIFQYEVEADDTFTRSWIENDRRWRRRSRFSSSHSWKCRGWFYTFNSWSRFNKTWPLLRLLSCVSLWIMTNTETSDVMSTTGY